VSEIDEEFGVYLDSLVEPVEPEWVMGFVARRRRKRALIATGFGFALAATTGVVGYEIHAPSEQVRVGTAAGSSTTEAPSTTSTSVAATTSTTVRRPPNGPGPSAPPSDSTTTTPTTGPTSAVYHYARPGDAIAATTFSSSTITVGVPVEITVTLVNTRDYGVFVDDGAQSFAVYLTQPGGPDDFVAVGFGAAQVDGGVNLAPHAVLTTSVRWVPTFATSGKASLVADAAATPGTVNVSQSPTPFTVAPGPETTTTTTPVTTTTTTTP
jgi:hypothetical protein